LENALEINKVAVEEDKNNNTLTYTSLVVFSKHLILSISNLALMLGFGDYVRSNGNPLI
jgi:hypothetical protein